VWLQHRPSGIEVRCQAERSQAANRQRAWEELCARLEGARKAEAAARTDASERARRQSRQKSWGQKLRMVATKRHRARHKATRGRVGED